MLWLAASAPGARAADRLQLAGADPADVVSRTPGEVQSVRAVSHRITARFDSAGKAHALPDGVLLQLRKSSPALYRAMRGIRTAYLVRQEGRSFYLRALPAVGIVRLPADSPIDCEIYLLEVRTTEGDFKVPVIRSIKAARP